MDSKPKRGITGHKIGKQCLLSTRLSRVFNSQSGNSVFRRTWSYNHVLEYRPLETVQHLKRAPTHVSYLDCIHEVWLELTNKLTIARSGKKAG